MGHLLSHSLKVSRRGVERAKGMRGDFIEMFVHNCVTDLLLILSYKHQVRVARVCAL